MGEKETKCKLEKALERAEQVRQFEIGLYWKRSAYFWTFIALAFAGYGALQVQLCECTDNLKGLDFLLANVGVVASAAWFFVNRGSKYWQEHWETQVDRFENCVTGPLYKTVIARVEKGCQLKQWMTGATRISATDKICCLRVTSVSKINQLCSLYVAIIWIILAVKSSPWFEDSVENDSYSIVFVVLTVASLLAFWKCGKTDLGNYEYATKCREVTPPLQCGCDCGNCCQETSPLDDRGDTKGKKA